MRIIVLSALLFSTPVAALAHGIEATGSPAAGVQPPKSLFSFLVNPAEAAATIRTSEQDGYRYIQSDGMADHATGSFPNNGNPHAITKQDYNFRVPLNPKKASRTTALGHQNFGVALNGVPFDPLTAEYWNRDRASGWNIEALSGAMNLGLDQNMAHVQPNGAYHYHGLPKVLLQRAAGSGPVLLGYAADGFPIYGPYGFSGSALKGSYRLKLGMRPSGPGGRYDGTYVQDYEYDVRDGDLDACNGTTAQTNEFPGGTYLYVLTNDYPFIPRCWSGTPDSSFSRNPGGGNNRQMGPGSDRRPPRGIRPPRRP